MSEKERYRLGVLGQVECGALTLREAGELIGVGYRQVRRIHKRFRSGGASGLIHAACGRLSNNRLSQETRDQVLDLYRRHLTGYGPTLAAEVLEAEYGVRIHREALRLLLREECLSVPRTAQRAHRRRRKRRACFGELVQIDGSDHPWFGRERPACCLMVMVDDATGRVVCFFSAEETTRAAFLVYRKWVERYGVPEALYSDRKNVYAALRDPNDVERQLGCGALSDFGRGCWRLGTGLIQAHSPEAKGRVERMNGTLQDRLVKELARRDIHTIEAANALLDEFTDRLDAKFSIAPSSPVDRHRKRPVKAVLDDLLCWEEERVVARDWTIRYEGRTYQIPRQTPQPRPGERVTVRRTLAGNLSVVYQAIRLRFHPFVARANPASGCGCGNDAP